MVLTEGQQTRLLENDGRNMRDVLESYANKHRDVQDVAVLNNIDTAVALGGFIGKNCARS